MGSIEFKVILYGLIFMVITNISLGYIIDESMITNYDAETEVSDYVDSLDLGWFSGGALSLILSISSLFFSLFGVDFILMIEVLPTFMLTILTFFNVLIVFSLIMYLIDRIWIG
jgi:hypothetical protein